MKTRWAKDDSKIPLVDEGYEYRDPTKIFLQKKDGIPF